MVRYVETVPEELCPPVEPMTLPEAVAIVQEQIAAEGQSEPAAPSPPEPPPLAAIIADLISAEEWLSTFRSVPPRKPKGGEAPDGALWRLEPVEVAK